MSAEVKFIPIHENVLVKRFDADTQTKGGLIIPDTVKEKPMQGQVVAVSKGKRDNNGNIQPLNVKVGDKVMLNKWGGVEIKLKDGHEYLIVKESEILGILLD